MKPLLLTLAAATENLNGPYLLSPTPKGRVDKYPARYADYPGGAESFDVYSEPVKSLYSQVYWKTQPPVPLPEEVVKRLDGQAIAVVGFELNQVRRTPDGDIPVPINV